MGVSLRVAGLSTRLRRRRRVPHSRGQQRRRGVYSASVGIVVASSGSAVLEGPRTTGYCPSTACLSDTDEDNAASGGPKRSSTVAVVAVEPATPQGDLASELAAYASTAAGVLVPEGGNGNHNGGCPIVKVYMYRILVAAW